MRGLKLLQFLLQVSRGELQVLALADEAARQAVGEIEPLLLNEPVRLQIHFRRSPIGDEFRVDAQPASHGCIHLFLRIALIDNGEPVREADQVGPLADDIMRQAVQRANAVSQVGDELLLLQEG